MFYRQEISFLRNQRDKIQSGLNFPEKSKIANLCPILDNKNIMRVGGRIDRAETTMDKKHPIIVPADSRISYLILHQTHLVTKHGATQVMMQAIRQKYWIPHLRNKIRAYIHKCVLCARYAKNYEAQLMSDLPSDRINRNRAFLITGVDYAGPIDIVEQYKRKTNLRKCWIAVFVCMVTRANTLRRSYRFNICSLYCML